MSEAAENEGSATLPDDKTDTVVNEQEVSSDSAIEITEDKSVTTSELSDSDSVVSESAVENVPTETTKPVIGENSTGTALLPSENTETVPETATNTENSTGSGIDLADESKALKKAKVNTPVIASFTAYKGTLKGIIGGSGRNYINSLFSIKRVENEIAADTVITKYCFTTEADAPDASDPSWKEASGNAVYAHIDNLAGSGTYYFHVMNISGDETKTSTEGPITVTEIFLYNVTELEDGYYYSYTGEPLQIII